MKRIKATTAVFKMSPNNKPVESVNSGDVVVFETYDCFSNSIKKEEQLFSTVGWELINPATGPLYINDAEAGDILKIDVLDISVKDQGVMTTAPKLGVLGDLIPNEKTKIIPIVNGEAVFNEKIKVSINPMIGVIGTAPKEDEISTGTPGGHGGNMDCKRIVKGATLYLPVNVEGGLLAMGDLHALMGDGEIVICGVEISGEITIKVTVLKNIELPLPMLVEGDEIMTIASEVSLDDAAIMATKQMHSFLTKELKMDIHEAGMLLSMVGNLKICQVVDPLKTARMELPLWILDIYNYILK
ncbi:acetamidase/formamidase family protein [Alkaliphilus peptidifermentans]|uniref:Amidase n=1 Tax=Alkaliphilus peptidifermentans DSM 18978 TaxID=1120976 RepID=A0A1G5I0H7_9FIRM|nr:acetamidase/formamidase family protein [Alkaliphilus peptidifermentans]SCY69229.1 amidase [Alkaliphilus peptidifermentans DSM 18978]